MIFCQANMKGYLNLVILLFFCVLSESSIRMQRDFSYPTVNDFKVYWNVPTFLCQKHDINFEPHTKKFGIISNSGDKFRGELINILYDPGLFPAMMKNPKGRMVERNGGIPQLGNLTLHLEAFKEAMNQALPPDFDGVGIIDFEAWRPIFRQHWNDQVIYKTMSRELVKQQHPQWPESKIETHAVNSFEDAARTFMGTTLQLAKLLRPKAVWGYYAFPYCFNFRDGKQPHCSEMVERENNKIQWLFDESTALYPSLYMSKKLSEEEHKLFVIGRLNEAWRMASRSSSRRVPPVYPYMGYKYYDSEDFLNKNDVYNMLEITRKYRMGGAIIWGSSDNVSNKEKCQDLLKYLNNVLGPAVQRVRENGDRNEEPNSGLVPRPFLPQVSSSLFSAFNHKILPKDSIQEHQTVQNHQELGSVGEKFY